MEDIKILKRIWRKLPLEDSEGRVAIENLIARNKDLETINKMQKYRINEMDIPKSKVEEKIKYIGKLYAEDEIDCEWYSEMKQLLQELLESEE